MDIIFKRAIKKMVRMGLLKEIRVNGLARSGSTLCYNLAKDGLPKSKYVVTKSHSLGEMSKVGLEVVTFRNPFDMVASVMRVEEHTEIDRAADSVIRNGAGALVDIACGDCFVPSPVLLVKYENFYGREELVLDKLFSALRLTRDVSLIEDVVRRYRKEYVRELSLERGSFWNYNVRDNFHGNHVSEKLGQPESYYLTSTQKRYVEKRFQRYLEIFYPAMLRC